MLQIAIIVDALAFLILILSIHSNWKFAKEIANKQAHVIVKCNLVYRTLGQEEQKTYTDELVLDLKLSEHEGLQRIQNIFEKHFEDTKQDNYLLTDIIFVSLHRIR